MSRRRLTKDQLSKEADIQLRDNAREMLQKFFTSVKKKIDDGDNRTIEMVGRMFQFDKGPGGVTIFNQHLQVNGAGADAAPARVRSFDQIVAKLEDRDRIRTDNLLQAPLDNSEEDDDEGDDDDDEEDIAEAETEEVAAPVAE